MTRPLSCLSELVFASLLQYGPDGTSAPSKSSQEHVRWIKRGRPAHVTRIGDRVLENIAKLEDTFDKEALLVPVPRSRPMKDPSALWPAMRIADELMRRGLGRDVRPLLVRRAPIEKSALLRDGSKRPGPEDHVQTIDVIDPLQVAAFRIVLVDDVVTRGATLLGCATLLRRVLSNVELRAFAAVRTMSGVEIDQMLAPVTGLITYRHGRLHREP